MASYSTGPDWVKYYQNAVAGYTVPSATPTPYISPNQGGNKYVTPGTVGVSISKSDQPVQSTSNNGVVWKSGIITPSSSVAGYTTSPSSSDNSNSSGGGGNNGGGDSGQTVNTPSIEDQINSIYAPIASYLESAKGSLDTEYGNYKSELNTQYDNSASKLATQKQSGLTELASDQTAADKRKTDALTAATNLYNELMRGGRQRFGGATSAGQAYTELSNTELQKSSNSIQSLWEEASQKITQYKSDLETQYESNLKDLELARTSALNQAYSDYQNKIQEINMYKAQNESNKASAKLDALNNLRNQVYNLNLNALNLATTLANNKQVALNYVDQYSKKVANNLLSGQNVYTSLTENTTTSPTSYLSNIGSSGKSSGTQTQTGSISSGKKTYEDYLSSLY